MLPGQDEGALRIDFGDAASTLDRTMRAITMVADGAMGSIVALGWNRRVVSIKMDRSDPLPCWVTLKGKKVFEISIGRGEDGTISIQGNWIGEGLPSPKLIDRLMGRAG